jgi:hypothetical protein
MTFATPGSAKGLGGVRASFGQMTAVVLRRIDLKLMGDDLNRREIRRKVPRKNRWGLNS